MSFLYANAQKVSELNQEVYSHAKSADKAPILGCEKTRRVNKRNV